MRKILKLLDFISFLLCAASLAFAIVERDAFVGIGWFCACILSGRLYLED